MVFIWRARIAAIWVTALVGGMADLGYLLSVAPPGYANIVPGTVMTFISGTAIILSLWVWRLQARRGVVEDRGSKKDAESEFAHVEGLGHGGHQLLSHRLRDREYGSDILAQSRLQCPWLL